jgi:glycerate kinase
MTLTRLPHGAFVVIAPDSFKGSTDAVASAAAIGEGWSAARGQDRLRLVPMADGGEGTLGIVTAQFPGTCMTALVVEGPNREPVRAQYAVLPDGTAMVELAASSGLPLARGVDARRAPTYGFGQLLAHAAARPDVRKLLIGLGGSATTDGAAGAVQALGARLLDENGRELPRGGASVPYAGRSGSADAASLRWCGMHGRRYGATAGSPWCGRTVRAAEGRNPRRRPRTRARANAMGAAGWGAPRAPGAGAAGGACCGLVTAWARDANWRRLQ